MALPPRQQQGQTDVQIGGLPPGFKVFTLEKYMGVNSKPTRPAIDDQEFTWCENFFPLGDGNLRTLYGKGATLYTAAAGKTIISFFSFNRGDVSYMAVFLDDGTADEVKVSDGTVVHITTTASTFYTSGSTRPGCAQWGAQYLIIVTDIAADKYFIWDGTNLCKPGTLSPAVTVTNGGNSYTSSPSVAASGGGGTGATFSAAVLNGAVTTITVTNPGSGYTAASTVTLAITGGGGSGATAKVLAMPFGIKGTGVETFQSRVWVIDDQKLIFTASGAIDNFATSSGGGSIMSTDPFLKQHFRGVRQSNGYLYLYGDSSINVISNIQQSGSPPTTTFNNANTDPQNGTPWRDTIVPWDRALLFANPIGIAGLYGGDVRALSEKLDGLFIDATLPVTGTNLPSAATAEIFGTKTYMILLTVMDPLSGTARPVLLMWDGKKWFIGSQEVTLTFVTTQEVNSALTAWGTDGNIIFPLFQTATTGLTKKFQGKLWGGAGYLVFKQVLRAYMQAIDNAGTGVNLTVNIDSETTSVTNNFNNLGIIIFQNNTGDTIQFQNNSNQNINFTVSSASIVGQNADTFGKLIGLTVTTTSEDFTLISAAIGYIERTAYA